MKYKSGNFIQVNREIFGLQISPGSKWLYIILTELEHRFTGEKTPCFFRSTEDLEKDSGLTAKTIRKYRYELEEAGLIRTWKAHWKDEKTGKLSKKMITGFKILR